jgi:O-acetylserine/cysteine efflux transporter
VPAGRVAAKMVRLSRGRRSGVTSTLHRRRRGRNRRLGLLVSGGTGQAAAHVAIGALLMTVGAAAAWALANVIIRASGEKRPLSMLVWSGLVPPIPLIGLHSVSRIAPFSLLVPVFGLAASWLVLDEAVTWRLAGCAVLVLVGLGLVVRGPRTVYRAAPSGTAGLVAGSGDHSEGEEVGHARTLVVRTGDPVLGGSVDD